MADDDLADHGGRVEEREDDRRGELVGESPCKGRDVERDRELREALDEGRACLRVTKRRMSSKFHIFAS